METLLHERTTNQPRSVHSGRGDKSIAYDGWEAKSTVTGRDGSGVPAEQQANLLSLAGGRQSGSFPWAWAKVGMGGERR
jgi:hypothetical protein